MHLSSWLPHVREPTWSCAASAEMPDKNKASEMPSIFKDEINLRTTPPYYRSNLSTYERSVAATTESGCVVPTVAPWRCLLQEAKRKSQFNVAGSAFDPGGPLGISPVE